MAQHVVWISSLAVAMASIGCGENATPPPTRDRYTVDATPLTCAPDLDGKIVAAELAPAFDVPASYLINPVGKDRTVDLVGAVTGGKHVWSFGTDFADDAAVSLTATHVAGKWYATSFPTGEFVAAIDAAQTTDGVYRHDDTGLYFLGVASHNESPPEGKTLLVYDKPILLYQFPLQPGAKWTSVGTITNGTVRGLPYAGKDTYEIEDDAVGKLVLHDFTFDQVHRVRTKVTVAPSAGGMPTSKRQVGFVAECFGEVVRATSKNDEPNPDFTTAVELRRLGQ
ncbi:MAG: hypothetical protein ACXWP4_22160 [Polyangiales bacterium]